MKESEQKQIERQPASEYLNRLKYLKTETLYGHGLRYPTDRFDWEESASILDKSRGNGVDVSFLKNQLSQISAFNWDFTMQLAEDRALPLEMDYRNEGGQMQMLLLDAIDQLPIIAAEQNTQILLGLANYGIDENSREGKLLKYLIYDNSHPEQRKVGSFRLDTVGGKFITEAQLAMGGWAASLRIPMAEHHIGSGQKSLAALMEIIENATGKADFNLAMFVDEGVQKYWPEFCDFTFANGKANHPGIYAVGNGGFRYEKRQLYYVNSHSGLEIPIDAVYTLADARRLLKTDCLPMLTAARRGDVYIEPTLNPLLNNYHLIRGLLFSSDEYLEKMLVYAFSKAGSADPERDIQKAKSMTIPMSIVELGNTIDLQTRVTWQEILDNLSNRNGNGEFLGKAVRKELIVRVLLSYNLGSLSGGFGSVEMSRLSVSELKNILEESCLGMHELRISGRTDKTIVGVEPLVRHEEKTINVYDILPDGRLHNEQIIALNRFCPFYYRDKDEKVQLMSALSFYSATDDATYKLGGRIYAQGAHY